MEWLGLAGTTQLTQLQALHEQDVTHNTRLLQASSTAQETASDGAGTTGKAKNHLLGICKEKKKKTEKNPKQTHFD